MKLIVQIPCYNEEETLPITLADIPRDIPGIDKVEILIIDDGSNDRTIEVARDLGVDHIVSFPQNKGLARAFAAGLDASLRLGADIIVNTDGDNQYSGADIPKLVQPILQGQSEIVIGDRQVETIEHFSKTKIALQKLGSWVVRKASSTDVPDTTSGFRAYSREAAMQINVISDYTYTLETIIEAGHRRLGIESVPVGTNGKLRESRLFSSIRKYISRSAMTIVRMYTMYKPLRVFLGMGGLFITLGLLIGLRFIYFYYQGNGAGHVQSLILMAVCLLIGFQLQVFGLIADLIAANRKINEEILHRVKRLDVNANHDSGGYYFVEETRRNHGL